MSEHPWNKTNITFIWLNSLYYPLKLVSMLHMLTLQTLMCNEGSRRRTGGPFGTLPQEPWHPSTLNIRFWPNSDNHRFFFQMFVILFVSFLFFYYSRYLKRTQKGPSRNEWDILFDIIRNLLKSMFVKKRVYCIFIAFFVLIFPLVK